MTRTGKCVAAGGLLLMVGLPSCARGAAHHAPEDAMPTEQRLEQLDPSQVRVHADTHLQGAIYASLVERAMLASRGAPGDADRIIRLDQRINLIAAAWCGRAVSVMGVSVDPMLTPVDRLFPLPLLRNGAVPYCGGLIIDSRFRQGAAWPATQSDREPAP